MSSELANFLIKVTAQKVTLTQDYRLRNANMGYFDSYFDITCSYDAYNRGYIFTITYLPYILSDPKKLYYKSGTKKAGGFFAIKDICEHVGIPNPEKGNGYKLQIIDENINNGVGKYFLPQEAL